MSIRNTRFQHGDHVLVYDGKGNYECRGAIVGVYACETNLYDVQPHRSESLARRLHAVPEDRLRRVPQQVRAYERKPDVQPQHVLDEV